ncbi:MAG TPA: histidine kinase [Acidimicrobiales bacterium]|nr:histidine kinase [Acidimicrobiales bacterium]
MHASEGQGPQWWLRRHPEAIAIPVAVFQVVVCYAAGQDQPDARSFDALAFVLLAGSGLALAARIRFPVLVLAVTAAATILYHALGYPNGPFVLALVIAVFGAIGRGHRLAAWIIAAVGYAGYFVVAGLVGWRHSPPLAGVLGFAAWLIVVLVVADLVRVRRERAFDAAHGRAEEERRRQSEERLRMAQELHDVLAHNISLINVQAGVALHLIDERPEQARIALAAIKDASKDALGELRSVLGILRAPDDEAPRGPAPTLARLDGLVAQAAAAGLAVDLDVDGEPRPLPAPVDLAAFRIVQEALTNVTRHAGTARRATVHVHYDEGDVTVQIDDDGTGVPVRTGASTVGTGSGIQGMRDRAAALGGTLEAGPRASGGFRVLVTLPVKGNP